MSKNTLFLGIISIVVVIGCAAGGAIFALNTANLNDDGNKSVAKYETLQEEKTKLNGWQQKNGQWYWYKDDVAQTGWIQDNGSWYYLDSSGKMKLNWVQDKSKWFYLGSDGKMRTGWVKDNDKWYFMNNDGTMAVNTTVDGNYINENGVIEETPKPTSQKEVDANNRQANDSKKHVLTVEEARQLAVNYLNNHDKSTRYDRTYYESRGMAAEIEAKYNVYLFVPENDQGDDYDKAICVNKYTGQLYNHNPINNSLTPIN